MILSAAPSTLTDLHQPSFPVLVPQKFVGSFGAAMVAGLRRPVLLRGAGSAKEESGRPTWWPCVRRCQPQPADCRRGPVAPHRATGRLGLLSLLLPSPRWFLSVPEFGATLA
jgi:hypothetical protein